MQDNQKPNIFRRIVDAILEIIIPSPKPESNEIPEPFRRNNNREQTENIEASQRNNIDKEVEIEQKQPGLFSRMINFIKEKVWGSEKTVESEGEPKQNDIGKVNKDGANSKPLQTNHKYNVEGVDPNNIQMDEIGNETTPTTPRSQSGSKEPGRF